MTMEDTWRPGDLRRYVREGKGDERRHRAGESSERRHRDPERESRQERDKQRERESTQERKDDGDGWERTVDKSRDRRDEREREKMERDKLVEGRRYGGDYKESRNRRQAAKEKHERDKDKERHRDIEKEREREKRDRDRLVEEKRYAGDYKESRDWRRDGEEKHERERDKYRHRGKEKERDGRRRSEEERGKTREERDKEKRRDSEHRTVRDRQDDKGEKERGGTEKTERERRERNRERERYKEKHEDRTDRGRHGDRKHLELKEDRGHTEEHRRHKAEKESRHKERGHHDERRRHDFESERCRGSNGSAKEVKHHRGGAEWDEHKEIKRKETKEEENIHGDRNNSKKMSDKSHRYEAKTEASAKVSEQRTFSVTDVRDTEEPVVNDEELANQEYEDDFEDYEEDFEEMDESENEGEDEEQKEEPKVTNEIEEIQRAMEEENERARTAQSRQIMSREEDDGPKSPSGSEKNRRGVSHRGKFIDFVAAKQREVSQKVATKQKKRSEELLRFIDLDFSVTFSILDLPPVNEYDMYIRKFGMANTKQAYVQCNEDNADRDIQTEEIEVSEKWTQHPPEHNRACGDPNCLREAQDKTISEINFDSQRLTAFLRSASQVMVVLLEEDQAERTSLRKLASQTDMLSFSDGSLELNTKLPFLFGRSISLVHFSQAQRQTMLSVHSPTAKPSAVRLDCCTVVCIWNIWEPSRPQKVLIYESEVQCCCFSPGKAILVFAGTSVGSVVLWDLRETTSNHYCLKIGQEEWTFRQPTFSTDAVMAGSGHFSSVTSVEVVPSTVAGGLRPEVPLLASEEESSGLSFQLASLDETGVLNFWVVVELPKANEAGSQTDLGLRPGGKVKLLHSSSVLTSGRGAETTGPVQTLKLKFLPTDSNHFFIGTNMGLVNHGTSHGLKAPPKFYRCQEAGVRPVNVSSIQFCPFVQHLFLVGCGDGSIRLHVVSHEQPVAEWKSMTGSGEPVVSLQWSRTRPAVFCVLDAASKLHIWDLLKNDREPVVTEEIHSDRVTAMALFGDSGQQNTYSGIALAHESGTIEMQYFTSSFTAPVTSEVEKLDRMITEAL